MKTIKEFLLELANLDVLLKVEKGNLRCYAPPNTLTTEIRTQLTVLKAEIVNYLQVSHFQKIDPRPLDIKQLPLSWGQERLWFLEQLEGASATYNMSEAICLNGDLDVSALEQALGEIVQRHEVLRTSFVSENGKPRQVIHGLTTRFRSRQRN